MTLHRLTGRGPWLLALGAALSLLCGCERPGPPPAEPQVPNAGALTPEPAEAEEPDLPAGASIDELVSTPIIKDRTVANRHKTATYRRNPKAQGGGVLGLCYIPFGKHVTVPRRTYVAVEGDNAARNPEKGEVAYYQTHMPWKPVLLGAYNRARKRYGVERAAIMVRNVTEGPRAPLGRPVLVVDHRTGQLRVAENGYNFSAGGVVFMPLNERVQIYNIERYSCDLAIADTATGRAIFRSKLPGYRDPKFPGKPYVTHLNMTPPNPLQTRPITEPGRYRVTCARHPWLAAHLLAVDNPYVAVSDENGVFQINGLPEGTYRVDAWHPQFEPERSHCEIEISAHRTEELLVPFQPPTLLADPPPLPRTVISRWAVVGPFERGRESYPPEAGLDFGAAYKTAYKYKPVSQPLRWRVGGGRLGHYHATSFFYNQLHSPNAQKVRFGFGAFSHKRGWQGVYTYRAWVNGRLIYSYHGEWHGRNAAIVPYTLKVGRNDLLIRLDTSRYNHWAEIVVAYESDGVTARLPSALRPKKGK